MQVVCVACGARATVPGFAAGSMRYCPECGTVLVPTPPVGCARSNSSAGDDPDLTSDLAGVSSDKAPPESAAKSPPGGAAAAPWRRWVLPVSGFAAAFIFLALSLGQAHLFETAPAYSPPVANLPPDYGQSTRELASFEGLKASADAMALSGRLDDAYGAYEGMLIMIGKRGSHDPLIMSLVDGVHMAQNQVFAALMRQKYPGVSTAAAQPSERQENRRAK